LNPVKAVLFAKLSHAQDQLCSVSSSFRTRIEIAGCFERGEKERDMLWAWWI